MRRFFTTLWRVITFPFRLIFNILAFPFRGLRRFSSFMNSEPEEHPLGDVVSGVMTDAAVRQLLWDQIDALRMHLLRALIGLAVGVAISFYFTNWIIGFLALPLPGGLESLRAIKMTENIGVFMRVALLAGVAISLPYIAFELWAFAAPGLRPRERRYGLIGIPLASLLFLTGAAFTYYIMLPAAVPFLLNFLPIPTQPQPESYYGFVTGLMFWIGVAFEFPLVIYVLTAMGLIKPQILKDQWRIAIILIAVMAAAITPTIDPINMSLVMGPMILLYFLSIGLSYIAYAGRSKPQPQTVPQEGE